jgi:hypothetical protein
VKALDSLTVFAGWLGLGGPHIMRGSLGIWLYHLCSTDKFDREGGKGRLARRASLQAPDKFPPNIKYFAALNLFGQRKKRNR